MSPHAIQLSEDREEFAKLLKELDIPQPENGIARSLEDSRDMHRMGFGLYATPGTTDMCMKAGLPVEVVEKAIDGSTQIMDLIRAGKIQLVVNTPPGPHAHTDGVEIHKAAIVMNVPLLTIFPRRWRRYLRFGRWGKKELKYRSLQSHFGGGGWWLVFAQRL